MHDVELTARFLATQAVAREAGRLAARHFADRERLVVELKGVQDQVSAADREVESLIRRTLAAAFPGDGFLGEEGGLVEAGDRKGGLWVTDPIDGTANFVRGIPQWAVSIAYLREGAVEIGVVYDAANDELFAARRGFGSTRDGHPIAVSACRDLASAVVGVGFSFRRPVGVHVAAVRRALESHCEYRRTGAGALSLAHVADGRLDGYWEAHINAWDVLAGDLLVREAGGWTSDFLAADGLTAGNPYLACAPGIQAVLIEIVTPP